MNPSRHRRLLAATLLLLCHGVVGAAERAAMRVHLLLAEAGAPYTSVASGFEDQWRSTPGAPPLEISVALANDTPLPLAPGTTVVAVGVHAARVALQRHPELAVHATLVPRSTWERLLLAAPVRRAPVSAAWLDQPEERVMRLARLIAPRAKRLGVLLGPGSSARRAALETAAGPAGFEVVHGDVGNRSDPTADFERLLPDTDLLLALPDPLVWNRATVEPLMLASFRARRPLLGVSPALLASGAVAVLHTTPEQFGRELAVRLGAVAGEASARPPSSGPQSFVVSTNAEVARSLGLNLPPAQQLEAALRRAEGPP
jgi:putative ABC transport system substrate-binding protein